MEVKDSERFLRQIKKARQELKYNRENFWSKNKVNFRNNLKTLISFYKFPDGWNVSTIASYFLLDKGEVMPYDHEVWSFVDVVSGTEAQGKDIVVFFNRTDLEFLSLPALIPIVVHEMAHVEQAAKEPEKYIKAVVSDEVNKKYEENAEAEVKKYNEEFRKQNVMEKILFCFDKKSWKGARKMADYLFKEAPESFGGGYDQDMKKEEYETYEKAEEEKDIDIFIDYFINLFKEGNKEKIEEKK